MRRRFACEVTGQKLKVRVVEADDARAAVLMHIENADRQDITPMERAISFQVQAEAKVFPTQEAMAEALGVSKGQVAKMIKAAGLLKVPGDRGSCLRIGRWCRWSRPTRWRRSWSGRAPKRSC